MTKGGGHYTFGRRGLCGHHRGESMHNFCSRVDLCRDLVGVGMCRDLFGVGLVAWWTWRTHG